MSKYIDELVSISSDPLSKEQVRFSPHLLLPAGKLGEELLQMLTQRNGFFAFMSALHVFPDRTSDSCLGLDDWNSESLWRGGYGVLADGCLFFAEDIFGIQFCIARGAVCSFDPETGALEQVSNSLEGWAMEILSAYDYWTGYSLAEDWQKVNGALSSRQRLVPKIPFVCGGEYELNNLVATDTVIGMKRRACFAKQIVDLPDGSQIEFDVGK